MDPAALYQNSLGSIDADTQKLLQQYALLQQQAAAAAQQQNTQLHNDTTLNGMAFAGASGGASNDMIAAGFDPGAINAIRSLDQARLGDQSNRMTSYMGMLDQNQSNDNNARIMNALAVATGAKQNLASNYAALQAAGAGGGGGGGGGGGYSRRSYGGGGGGDGDVPTQGDAANIAKGMATLPDVTSGIGDAMHSQKGTLLLDAFLHGTGGKGLTSPNGEQQLLPGGFGHVSRGGGHAATLASKYMSQYDRLVEQNIISDSPTQRDNFNKKLLNEMRQVQDNAVRRDKAAKDRRTARNAAALRGYDNWNQAGDQGGNAPVDENGNPMDLSFLRGNYEAIGRQIKADNRPAPKPHAPVKGKPKKGGGH